MTAQAGTLVRGAYLLTAGEPAIIENGALRVLGDRIDDVGSWAQLRDSYPDDEVVGGPNDVVTPGFVNTHGHFSESLITGLAKRHTLWEWVQALIGPVAPHLDRDMAYYGTLLSGIQMLRTGITTTNDMFVCDPRSEGPTTPGVVDALEDLGLRGVVSFGAGDVRGASIGAIVEEHTALAEAAASSERCTFRVGIAALGAQSDQLLAKSLELVADHGGSHIHLQEVREEVTAVRLRFGVSPIAHCAATGLFDYLTTAAHCVWIDRDDIAILERSGVGVSHNPVSNMILASGICPVPQLRSSGVAVGIGVDGPASNDRQDMLEAIKMTSLIQRLHHLQATAMSSTDVLRMATIDGAKTLGLDTETGSLEPGKAADIVIFDGNSPALANIHDPVETVVFVAGPNDISQVWVGGVPVLKDGASPRVDQREAVEKSRPLARKLIEKSGVI